VLKLQDIIIRLRDLTGSGRIFTFPVNPETITTSADTSYANYETISLGAIKTPSGMNVKEVQWNGVFLGNINASSALVRKGYYLLPAECIAQLTEWQEAGTVLNLIVTDTTINIDVTISSFTTETFGAYGDVKYTISFSQYRTLKIYTTNELNIAEFVKKIIVERDDIPEEDNSNGYSYTIVSGDTLWGIAERELGNGADWESIYNANVDIIEATANEHGFDGSDYGHWIFPGTTISIPG
jgi:hypothetical protein